MPKPPVRAAIYARISSDQEGTALGVTRQVDDCRALAEKLGWTVADQYIDNDVSAYSGKKRPEYQRMLDDLAAGERDAVIAYHLDRLTRRPIELEHFVEIATTANVAHVRFVSGGDFDLVSGDGLMLMRMLAAVAAGESATKSRRMKRKNDETAAKGEPHKGGNRPFGFEDDWLTARPDEAAVIRTMAERFVAGESLRSIAKWLDAEGVKTVKGRPWLTTSVRTTLRNPRIAGLRAHRGDVVGSATWEPIITVAERDKVMALMDRRASTRERSPRSYLLTGLLRCGKCGNRLFSSRRENSRRYVCMAGPDHAGCGRLTVVAGPLEELITDAVLYRLDTPELAAALTGQAARDTETAAMSDALAQDRAHLDELAQLYGDRKINSREWMTARSPIETRVKDLERRLARATGNGALAAIIGNGESLRAQWIDLPLSRQAAIVKTILDRAIIGPGQPSARSLDPGRVDLVWRI